MTSNLLAVFLGMGQRQIDEALPDCDEAERVEILNEVFDEVMGPDPGDIAQARQDLVECGLIYGILDPESDPDFNGRVH